MGEVNRLYNTRTPRASALYRGPASRDWLCNRIADLEKKIKELESTNEELRKWCSELRTMADTSSCHLCGLPCYVFDYDLPPTCTLEERLRELGVELDERYEARS